MNDRRRTGVNRVQMADGSGRRIDVYTATMGRIRVWFGAAIAVCTLLGMIFAATRCGLGVEIYQQIKKESEPPAGVIYEQIEQTSREFIEEVQGVIQDDLDYFDREMRSQHDLSIRLEERQIAMEKKAADDKTDLIREIRRAGEGG